MPNRCRNNDRECSGLAWLDEAMDEFLRRDEVTATWIDEEVGPEFEEFARDFKPPPGMLSWSIDKLRDEDEQDD